MSELFDKSIRTLELPRVLQLLSEQAVSPEAKELALAVRPETDYEDVLRLLDQTDGARAMIVLRGAPGFSGVKPVKDLLDRADRGGSLNIPELIRIGDLLYAARRAKEYFNADAAEPTALDQIFLSIHGNRFLEDKIRRCISDENTVADAASPELADIRRHMRAALAKSRQILQKIISSPSYSKVLQDNIITQRDGRFVVPVRADQKGNLPGLIHDVSSTGATVFVEPMGVVQANNEYAELQAKEQAEIDRILAELSADAATTHYAELKTFAMTTPGVENASCEFNVETLSPTYRLLIGIPGKSNAFAISRRLGLPDEVITNAQSQMSKDSVRFEDVLTQLEAKRQALEKREQETDRLYRQREEDARKAREFREQMQRAKENARSRGEAEAKRILRDARSASDAVFAELERMRKEQAKADRAINANEARAELRRQLNEAEDAIDKRDARSEPIPKPSRPIQKGDLVEIPGVSTPAEVVGVGSDGTLQLKAGILKMKAKADEVRLIEDDERAAMKKKAPKPTWTAVTGLRTAASRELDIRGMETLEAESVVETFLSTAVMGHLETVTIIHGKGTGALRNAVHDILRRNKNVKSFRLGVYGEGENGVTVVTMK